MKFYQIIPSLLFPQKCPGCGTRLPINSEPLCHSCAEAFFRAEYRICKFCGETFTDCTCAPEALVSGGVYKLTKLMAYLPSRDSRENNMIWLQKRTYVKTLVRFFATELASRLRAQHGERLSAFTLTNVPRSPVAVSIHGFDQSALLARELTKILNLPYEICFARTRNSLPQKKLNAAERRRNVLSGIYLRKNTDARGKRYIIIDDIATTCASLARCSELLHESGALEVAAAVIAVSLKK